MEQREAGLTEIEARLTEQASIIGLASIKRTPTKPINDRKLPCVVIIEDVDILIKKSTRGRTGYPAKRMLEVVLEIIAKKDEVNITTIYKAVRTAVFLKRGLSDSPMYDPNLSDNVFINENRTEGPTGYGLPNLVGMRLVLDLIYTDGGF